MIRFKRLFRLYEVPKFDIGSTYLVRYTEPKRGIINMECKVEEVTNGFTKLRRTDNGDNYTFWVSDKSFKSGRYISKFKLNEEGSKVGF